MCRVRFSTIIHIFMFIFSRLLLLLSPVAGVFIIIVRRVRLRVTSLYDFSVVQIPTSLLIILYAAWARSQEADVASREEEGDKTTGYGQA